LRAARLEGGRVALELQDDRGRVSTLSADHIVAATGYKPDLARLPFLDAELRGAIDQVDGTPVLSDNFEASVGDLYFVGLAAANSFGPLLRFMFGAEFAAPRLAAHLRRRIAASTARKAA
jgi:hypothetical protein